MGLAKTSDFGVATPKMNGRFNGKPPVGDGPTPPAAPRASTPTPLRKQVAAPPAADQQRRRQRTFGRQQKAAERIASATTQVASGIAEAAAACDELSKAMEQISTGADEAAAAAEQSQRAMTRIAASNRATSEAADGALRKTETLQSLLSGTNAQIQTSLVAVGRAAERQSASVNMVIELDKQAASIGDIVKAVARIADQTNLLALNAAIEAARAGQHGKGFAVVADEVRTLAETSEKSARDIQDLVAQIQVEVKVIADGIAISAQAAKSEVESGRVVTEQLEAVRVDMGTLLKGAQEILAAAHESDSAAQEAQKGAEAISSAAAEQSSACEEAVKTVEQQTTALTQSEQAASALSELADELKNSTDIGKSAEEVASASEELSSAVEEINRAATQIMTALDQIGSGAQQQSAATQQASTAIAQIEKGAQLANDRSVFALEKGEAMSATLAKNREAMERIIAGVQQSVESNFRSREQIIALEQVSRRIDKIVDAIATVSIQTNMLAVNGSIEAARAGEFGKGFMVVSTDIRNLARDSSTNAEQIKDLVKSVQDQIVAVRRDLEEIASLATAEVEKNRAIAANLSTVGTDMGVVLAGSRGIAAEAGQILRALQEARTGVEQISTAAIQASQATKQAAQAAQEQSKGTEELASAVEEIASLADELQNNDAA
jgi:methyl-accepting chemotaxis protein